VTCEPTVIWDILLGTCVGVTCEPTVIWDILLGACVGVTCEPTVIWDILLGTCVGVTYEPTVIWDILLGTCVGVTCEPTVIWDILLGTCAGETVNHTVILGILLADFAAETCEPLLSGTFLGACELIHNFTRWEKNNCSNYVGNIRCHTVQIQSHERPGARDLCIPAHQCRPPPPRKKWDWFNTSRLYVMYKVPFVRVRARVYYFHVNIVVVRNIAACNVQTQVPKFQRYSCHRCEDVKYHPQTVLRSSTLLRRISIIVPMY